MIVKKRASGFHGTNLSSYLNAQGVDTVIVMGATRAGACVIGRGCDARSFSPIVVREAVGDVPGVVEWNLFNIDEVRGCRAALGGVEYLDGIELIESRSGIPVLATV